MNVGIIGFGLMGKQRAEDISQLDFLNLKSVFDKNTDELNDFKKKYGFQIKEIPEDIINDSDIELIILSVPHNLIKDYAVRILNQGKHLLCEKPLGRTINESKKIINNLDQSFLEPGFNYRYYDGIKKIKTLINDNEIGKVHSMRCVLGHGGRPGMEKEWKLNKKLCGGGALLDPGIHVIDLTRYLIGEIDKGFLSPQNSFWETDIEDNVMVLLDASGVKISLNISLTEWKSLFRIEIFGSDGAVYFSGRSRSYGSQKVELVKRWFWKDKIDNKTWEYPDLDNSFKDELKDFYYLIKGKENSIIASHLDGYRAIEIIENLYNSPNQLIAL